VGEERAKGGCLCGAVRYRLDGPLRQALVCHCRQCQRTHGAPAIYTSVPEQALILEEERGLAWYSSSPSAKRGFCRFCGASLFWKPEGKGYVAVACGALDPPSGVTIAGHIFVESKGDYYEIHDDLPQNPQGTGGAVVWQGG